MTDQKSKPTPKPDAFKQRMADAQVAGRPELAHQSLGRALSDNENALAVALMEIYATGTSGPSDVAAALTKSGVAMPSTGDTRWTAEGLAAELKALNDDLDAAYAEDGFGA